MLPRNSMGGEGVGANWRCEFDSFESTVDPINKALSASLFDIFKTILASP
jgi:hypothetical protein